MPTGLGQGGRAGGRDPPRPPVLPPSGTQVPRPRRLLALGFHPPPPPKLPSATGPHAEPRPSPSLSLGTSPRVLSGFPRGCPYAHQNKLFFNRKQRKRGVGLGCGWASNELRLKDEAEQDAGRFHASSTPGGGGGGSRLAAGWPGPSPRQARPEASAPATRDRVPCQARRSAEGSGCPRQLNGHGAHPPALLPGGGRLRPGKAGPALRRGSARPRTRPAG